MKQYMYIDEMGNIYFCKNMQGAWWRASVEARRLNVKELRFRRYPRGNAKYIWHSAYYKQGKHEIAHKDYTNN